LQAFCHVTSTPKHKFLVRIRVFQLWAKRLEYNMLPACFSGFTNVLNKQAACSTMLTEKLVSGNRRDRNDTTVGEFRFTFFHPKIDKYNGTLFRRAAYWSHRFVTRYSSLVTRYSLSWTASAKSGILPMKLITFITKYGLLNPLTQMFYSIFIKKSRLLDYINHDNLLLCRLLTKETEKPVN